MKELHHDNYPSQSEMQEWLEANREIYTDFKKVSGEMPRAPKSTGSVKGSGKTNDRFFTRDQVAAMSRDEIRKNFDVIERSRKKW